MDYVAVPAIVRLRTESLTGQQNHLPRKINIITLLFSKVNKRSHIDPEVHGWRWKLVKEILIQVTHNSGVSSLHLLENIATRFQRIFSPTYGCKRALLNGLGGSTADLLKFRRCCPIILYRTALRKHPNVRKQVGWYRLSPGPWPRKQKNPDNLKQLTPPQHASLHFPSSKLLLLPGLNTGCSLFKATEAAEWN